MRTGNICQATFASKTNLRQHRINVHKLPPYYRLMECAKSHLFEFSVAPSDTHLRHHHWSSLAKMCIHCGFGFDDVNEFFKHRDET